MKAPVPIEVSPSVGREMRRLPKALGMTQLQLHSRMIGWLGRQDDQVQALILDIIPEAYPGEAAVLVLKALADSASK